MSRYTLGVVFVLLVSVGLDAVAAPLPRDLAALDSVTRSAEENARALREERHEARQRAERSARLDAAQVANDRIMAQIIRHILGGLAARRGASLADRQMFVREALNGQLDVGDVRHGRQLSPVSVAVRTLTWSPEGDNGTTVTHLTGPLGYSLIHSEAGLEGVVSEFVAKLIAEVISACQQDRPRLEGVTSELELQPGLVFRRNEEEYFFSGRVDPTLGEFRLNAEINGVELGDAQGAYDDLLLVVNTIAVMYAGRVVNEPGEPRDKIHSAGEAAAAEARQALEGRMNPGAENITFIHKFGSLITSLVSVSFASSMGIAHNGSMNSPVVAVAAFGILASYWVYRDANRASNEHIEVKKLVEQAVGTARANGAVSERNRITAQTRLRVFTRFTIELLKTMSTARVAELLQRSGFTDAEIADLLGETYSGVDSDSGPYGRSARIRVAMDPCIDGLTAIEVASAAGSEGIEGSGERARSRRH